MALPGQDRARQVQFIRGVITRSFPDQGVGDQNTQLFTATEDRGVQGRVYHADLVEVLDMLLHYQRGREHLKRDRFRQCLPGPLAGPHRDEDPRTFVIEFLKRWLRAAAIQHEVSEAELNQVLGFCRRITMEGALFPSTRFRATRFIDTMMAAHRRIQQHLDRRKVPEHALSVYIATLRQGRSTSQTLENLQVHGRNLVLNCCVFLLVGFTDLQNTDKLPSLGATTLWESLPEQWYSQPGRPDLQKHMKDAWSTCCGRVVAALVSSQWFVQLQEASSAGKQNTSVKCTLDAVRREMDRGFKNSGFAVSLQSKQHAETREAYFGVCQLVDDIAHFMCILRHCNDIARALGDYGIISLACQLHPLLDELKEKADQLQRNIEKVKSVLIKQYMMGKTKTTKLMQNRVIEAMRQQSENSQLLLDALQALRQQSDPAMLVGLREDVVAAARNFVDALQDPELRDRFREFRLPESEFLVEQSAEQLVDGLAIQNGRVNLRAMCDMEP